MNPTCKKVIWWCEFLIPIIVAIPFLFDLVTISEGTKASQCLGVTIITAAWWILEPIPIVVTAFFPVFLLPLFGVSTGKNIANAMFSDTSMIFLGGFLFSIAMVRWNLHSRIALKTVLLFGLRPKILLLGIIIITAFLSMWISNTATALTMVPNALAIITKIEELTDDPETVKPFAKALFLSIAYSASIGGMGTLIGTPPNLIFSQVSASTFKDGPEISFANFMGVATPTAIVILVIMYVYFVIFYLRKMKFPESLDQSVFQENYDRLGPMSAAEIIIGVDFILLAFMWLFRGDLGGCIGWANRLHKGGSKIIQDGTIALALGVLLFIIKVPPPTRQEEKLYAKAEIDLELRRRDNHNMKKRRYHSPLELASDNGDEEEDDEPVNYINVPGENEDDEEEEKWVPILDWEYVQAKIPWTILFLFSGGFALNRGFTDSTLSKWIGSKLSLLTDFSLFGLLTCISFITSILSNIASNTACANIILPIVASIARETQKYHPWMLMIPAAFATSCCFIMPVATPPNLICFGSGRLETKDFMIAGTLINIISLFVSIGMCILLIPPILDAKEFPEWAK